MYTQIGGKIKGLAKVVCWIGIIASILMGVGVIIAERGVPFGLIGGIVTAALGAMFSWAGSLALYGFGELVENVSVLASIEAKAEIEKRRAEQN